MRMYLIRDNTDTLTGMRLAGVDGVIANEKETLEKALNEVLKDKNIGIILLTWVMPVTRAIMRTTINVKGAIVPLVFGSVPFFARQVESALAQVDKGLIEASLSMGSSPLEIIFRVYLREGFPAIARGTTITAISLLNLTAMAGTVGAGGLGDFAVTLGHDRNMKDITNVTVLVLVLLVCLIELIGSRVAKKNTH